MSQDADPRAGGEAVRARVRRRLVGWAAGSLLGLVVLALPDTGPRVFSLSPGHGPSALDLGGVVLLVAAWLPVPVLLCSRPRPFRGAAARVAAGLVVVGVLTLAVTIRGDLGAWWLVPVALLVGVQVAGLRLLWTRDGPRRRGRRHVAYGGAREL
jgi:hypothetical protein